MRKFASLLPEERKEVFQAVSVKKGLRPEIIEKDFWVKSMVGCILIGAGTLLMVL